MVTFYYRHSAVENAAFSEKAEHCQPKIQNIKFALTSDNELLAKLYLLLEAVFANHSPQKEQCAVYLDSDKILWINKTILFVLCSVSCL